MSLLHDANIHAVALMGITRSVISAGSRGVLPLPGMELAGFMRAGWRELGDTAGALDNTAARGAVLGASFDAGVDVGPFFLGLRVEAGLALARMFPEEGVKAGELKDWARLREELAACHGPGETAALVGERWRKGDGRVVFMSSGSTGRPKAAAHSSAMLMQELEAVCGLFPSLKRVILLTPPQHCYGFMFGVLLPSALGLARVTLPPFPPMVREALAPGALVAGFPHFWRNMPHDEFCPPSGVMCLSATGPWPEGEQRALRASGYENILEIFGSSENGVMGWRRGPDEYFELLPYWSRCSGGGETLLRRMPDGKNEARPLQDALQWKDERHFMPAGRADNAVQVSGVNVYPAHISGLIAARPGVAACRVRLMRPDEGRRLKAFVVPEKGQNESALAASLKAFFQERLSPPERPAQLTFGLSLPKTMYGKDSDW